MLFLIIFLRDSRTCRELISADDEIEARQLFRRVHPFLTILEIREID